jgi:uncharacterized Fe-S cluster-containing MiaB family protein
VKGQGNVITMNKLEFMCFKTKNYLLFKNPFLTGTEVKEVQQSITSICFYGTAYTHMGKLNLQNYDV